MIHNEFQQQGQSTVLLSGIPSEGGNYNHLLSTVKLRDNVLGSVCQFVCLSGLSCLNRLTLIFGIGVDLDLGLAGIVGQVVGQRSRSNA